MLYLFSLGHLVIVLGAVAGQNERLFELNIIHYNDFHAHFDEVSPAGTVCVPSEEQCIGGFARLYTAIRQAKVAEPDSIVLNGGDTFQGTMWYNFLRWNVSYYFMNMIEHDAHVLGNHEFDHGVDGLVPYLERLNSPMLGANVNTTLEPRMTPYIKNHIIVERKGRKIGIIGVLLRVFSAPIGNVVMEDEIDAVNREAALLTAQGVTVIVVLSHIGFDSDMRMAQRISPHVDIIVGAHSHSLLYTGETPNGDRPVSQYPTVVDRSDGHKILVVQASCYTRYLGVIKLHIDNNGIIQSWEGQPVFLGSSIIPDPGIERLLEPWRQEVNAVGKEVLAKSRVTLNRSWCTRRECNMGSLVCDGFLEEMMRRPRADSSAWNGADLCLVNAGGLRVQMAPGDVTTEALLMALPFENEVQVYQLRGQHLLEALEFSVAAATTEPNNFYSRRMLQFGGLRVVFNVSAPAGSRVSSAAVRCTRCERGVPRYKPLDTNTMYRVLSQNYIGDGGGGYTMISDHRTDLEVLGIDYVMLRDYLRRQQQVIKDLDGRIQIVW